MKGRVLQSTSQSGKQQEEKGLHEPMGHPISGVFQEGRATRDWPRAGMTGKVLEQGAGL